MRPLECGEERAFSLARPCSAEQVGVHSLAVTLLVDFAPRSSLRDLLGQSQDAPLLGR